MRWHIMKNNRNGIALYFFSLIECRFFLVKRLIILLVNFLWASQVYAQIEPMSKVRVRISGGEKTLEQIFKEIEEQTDFSFTYINSLVEKKTKVKLESKEAFLSEFLSELGAKTGLKFAQMNRNIMVRPKEGASKKPGKKHRLSGYIEDASSQEKLFGATVVLTGTTVGTVSNFYGFFSFPVEEGEQDITFSYVGYQSQTITFSLEEDTSVVISLEPSVELEAVVVESDREESIELQAQVSSITLPSKQLKRLPAVGGEIDLLRALQLMPGVQSGKEGRTGIYVRGGGPDQNLILLDGVPLYSVSHLGGLFSVFNPDVVSEVKLMKGGFPARYGGRLSSVINVKVKDGNREERHTSGALGLVSSRLMTEGPINKGKGSYMVGGRRSLADVIVRPIIKSKTDGNLTAGYYFYDFNGKINYDFTEKDRVHLSIYSGDDKGFFKAKKDSIRYGGKFQWGNLLGTVKWNHLFSDKWFSNLTLNYTRYRFLIGYTAENTNSKSHQNQEYLSAIEDLDVRYETEYYLNQQHSFLSGVQYTEHFFKPGVTAIDVKGEEVEKDTTFGSFNVNAREFGWYLEDQWNISRLVKLNAGVRINAYMVGNTTYTIPQPRVTLRMLTGKNSSVKASYATMQQFVHLLSSSGVGIPSDLWVPATPKVKPQKSQQVTVAYTQRLFGGIEFSAEAYYKRMSNLIAYSEGENWQSGVEDWQERVETGGIGTSKGLELLLQKKEGKLTGWVGYTLSKTDRQFDGINFGKPFSYRYDRRHDVGLSMSYRINDRINLSATWVYGTGNAITLGQGRYLSMDHSRGNIPNLRPNQSLMVSHDDKSLDAYESRNNFRMRAYHRADVGVRFTKKKKWGERTWNIGIYNVYNRANPFFYYWGRVPNRWEGKRALKQISVFPIIPAVSYEFKF